MDVITADEKVKLQEKLKAAMAKRPEITKRPARSVT